MRESGNKSLLFIIFQARLSKFTQVMELATACASFDSSVGRAEDCRAKASGILRSLVQLRLEGSRSPFPASPKLARAQYRSFHQGPPCVTSVPDSSTTQTARGLRQAHILRASGAMDNASDYGSEDSRFDSWLARSQKSACCSFLET